MKIINVSVGIMKFPPDILGGGEGILFMLAKHFAKSGHEAIIIDRKHSKSDPDIEQVDGFHIVRLPSTLTNILVKASKVSNSIRGICLILAKSFFAIKSARYLNKNFNDDIVINTYDTYITFVFTLLLKAKLRKRIFFTLSSHTFYRRSIKEFGGLFFGLATYLGRFILRRINCVIVQNEFAQTGFRKLGVNNVRLIPPGTELRVFDTEVNTDGIRRRYGLKNEKVILFVGRINWEKGGDILLKAAGCLINQLGYKNNVFLVVGPFGEFTTRKKPDSFTQKVIKAAESLQITEKVKFTGMLPFDELLQAYKVCDIFVSPSRIENFCMVITEAMANGKPVVSTRHYGAPMQIKDGWNGFLVEVEDYQGLAEKIKLLLDSPEERRKMGANAKEFAKEFDWHKIAKRYLKIYKED